MVENLLFALLPNKGSPLKGKPSSPRLYSPSEDLELVIADSGVLLFKGGELAEVIPFLSAPELVGNCFDSDYVGLVPSRRLYPDVS